MLTIHGSKQRFGDDLTRRSLLKIGAFGAGLTLTDLLRGRASAATAPAPACKSAIMIWLWGGASQIDMYDLKPDAPIEFRGEFQPIATNVPGVQICEHMPLQAQMWDKLAVIRSVVSILDEHDDARVTSGYNSEQMRVDRHPSFGAVVSKLRAGDNREIPPFVSFRGGTHGTDPGWLGPAHGAFETGVYRYGDLACDNLRLHHSVDGHRVAQRKALLSRFDRLRDDLDAHGKMAGLDALQARAFDLVASEKMLQALDLSREDPRTRDRYVGVEQFLTARRLVEAGVGCVTMSYGYWDTHGENMIGGNNFIKHREQMSQLDRGLSHLIQDLHDRGLENDVVTVVWGEIGRTPRINANVGRDHWALMSAVVAGGGLKMGQAIGTSSARGEFVTERPYSIQQVLCTLYGALGIDPARTFTNVSGRPLPLLDQREPVSELL